MPVEIRGVTETLSAMRKFEPDLAKNLNKEVRATLTPIRKKAQGFFPSSITGLSNWMLKTKGRKVGKINENSSMFQKVGHFPRYSRAMARKGIKINIGPTRPNRKGFVTEYSISNVSAAGSIYETSGRANGQSRRQYKSNNPKAGEHFMAAMKEPLVGTGKMKGRALYRAWEEDHGKAFLNVVKAVDTTILQFKIRSENHAAAKKAA